MITLRPAKSVVNASSSVARIVVDVVAVDRRAATCTPMPCERVLDHAVRRARGSRACPPARVLRAVGRRRDDLLRAGRRRVAVLQDHQHRVVAVEQRRLHAGEEAVVPEAAVAHDGERAPLAASATRRRGSRGSCRSPGSSGRSRTARTSRTSGSRCRRRRARGPMSCCTSFSAANTGRSGQPMQNCGGRAGSGCASAAATASRRAVGRREPRAAVGQRHLGRVLARRTPRAPRAITSTVYSPAIGSTSLPCDRRGDAGAAQDRQDLLLDELGLPFLDHQHRALAARRSRAISSGTSGQTTLSARIGDGGLAERVGEAELLQRADQRVVEPALHDDAEVVARRRAKRSLSACSTM